MNEYDIKKKFLPWMPDDKLSKVVITNKGLVYKNEVLVASRTIQDLLDTTKTEDKVDVSVVETPAIVEETPTETVVEETPSPKKWSRKK